MTAEKNKIHRYNTGPFTLLQFLILLAAFGLIVTGLLHYFLSAI